MTTKTLMTAEEFAAVCDTFGSCELVRGEVVKLSPGGYPHSTITFNVAFLLGSWARQEKRGRILTNEAGHIVSRDPDTVRGADVAYLSFDRLPRGTKFEGFLDIAPELVVEVLGADENWRRMIEKINDYFGMGVDRVWVVEPTSCRLHIYRQTAEPEVLEEDATVTDATILPGFSCRVAAFFEE